MQRLASLVFLLVTASSAFAAKPYPVPEGARSAALAYIPRWIGAHGLDVDVDRVDVLDGYAYVMLIGPDVVRFAESGKLDPFDFATRVLYKFPIMVEEVYVGCVITRARVASDADSVGDFVFVGGTSPGGGTQRAVEGIGGFSRSRDFSMVLFNSESIGCVFFRFATDDGIHFLPVNHDAVRLFFDMGGVVFVPEDRAVPLIREEILDRARE